MTLLLVPTASLTAQETGEDAESDSTDTAAAAESLDEVDSADSLSVAPHPHEGFDFPTAEMEAVADVGLAWLALVDAGEFEECWASGSAALQTSASPEELKARINAGREKFRPMGARSLVRIQELRNPPGAPPGDYVMLQYRTEASGGRTVMTVIETVVPRREGDAWRVAAYFIQRE